MQELAERQKAFLVTPAVGVRTSRRRRSLAVPAVRLFSGRV